MSEPEKPILLRGQREKRDREHRKSECAVTLTDALDDHGTFDAVLVCAAVEGEGGTLIVRVYSANLNRFERLGLLADAKDALLRG